MIESLKEAKKHIQLCLAQLEIPQWATYVNIIMTLVVNANANTGQSKKDTVGVVIQ